MTGKLSGHAPSFSARLAAAPKFAFRQQRSSDRARLTMKLRGSKDIGSGWHLSGEASLEKGAHDHITAATVTLAAKGKARRRPTAIPAPPRQGAGIAIMRKHC